MFGNRTTRWEVMNTLILSIFGRIWRFFKTFITYKRWEKLPDTISYLWISPQPFDFHDFHRNHYLKIHAHRGSEIVLLVLNTCKSHFQHQQNVNFLERKLFPPEVPWYVLWGLAADLINQKTSKNWFNHSKRRKNGEWLQKCLKVTSQTFWRFVWFYQKSKELLFLPSWTCLKFFYGALKCANRKKNNHKKSTSKHKFTTKTYTAATKNRWFHTKKHRKEENISHFYWLH